MCIRDRITTLQVSNPNLVRGYALSSPTTYATYLHAYTDHTKPTTGVQITLDLSRGGVATWIEPATGRVLGAQAVSAGPQTLAAPAFTIDTALQVALQAETRGAVTALPLAQAAAPVAIRSDDEVR